MTRSQQASLLAGGGRGGSTAASPRNGLFFDVASGVDDVVEAWALVYASYLRAGLIDPNPARIHTVPQAIGSNTAGVRGLMGRLVGCTLSSYLDPPEGLPLDAVYPDELRALRDRGSIPIELGLFADRREHLYRSIDALLELMRFGTYFGVHVGATHGVIGVHPHHVNFYTRLLAFDVIGPERSYGLVKQHPVVLLQLDWYTKTKLKQPPRALAHFMKHPVPAEAFESRARLDAASIAGSSIERYLQRQTTGGQVA